MKTAATVTLTLAGIILASVGLWWFADYRRGIAWAVFVVRDGRVHVSRVTVGRSDGTRSVVEQGLDQGDEVVIQPSDTLQDGSRVAGFAKPTQ